MKFFISYSRSNKPEVGEVVRLLRAAGHEVWWDGDIPVIADWWATILDNIEWCEVFVFMVSEKSVQSDYCMAELKYATARNRPILPFVMDDHTRYTIPPEVTPMRNQWLVYDGPVHLLEHILDLSGKIQWKKHRDRSAPRPPEPNTGSGSLVRAFQQAVTLAEDGHFEEAIKRFGSISSLDFDEWGEECERWIARVRSYAEIMEYAEHNATFRRAQQRWQKYLQKDAENAEFDPFNLDEKLSTERQGPPPPPPTATPPAAEQAEAQRHTEAVNAAPPAPPPVNPPPARPPAAAKPRTDILPAPFAWIEIPNKGYSIAKYPVTNAHFAKFIEAGGYRERRWWTEAGWAQREKDKWTEPRYWRETKWNGAEHPVVGVSWYEAVAFCLWLSDVTGEKIMLPTEAQWQYAAQGDDGRAYPWGDEWDCQRCNNSVEPCKSDGTTPVRQYEGAGDSPFGVVDMAGNVWEWCLTAHETGSQGINGTDGRVLRGGLWQEHGAYGLRCDKLTAYDSHFRSDINGFRIVRIP